MLGMVMGGIRGWAEVTLRNPDGSVADHRVVHNVLTNSGRRNLALTTVLGSAVLISDDERVAGIKDGLNVLRTDLQTPLAALAPTVTWDAPTRTLSNTVTFLAPSSPPRTVRIIAFGHDGTAGNGSHLAVGAYLVMSPPLSQGALQTLEIVYRQQFTFPALKSMARWDSASLPNMQRWADTLGNAGLGWFGGGLAAGYSPFIAVGRHFWMDGGARYGLLYNTGPAGGWAMVTDPGNGAADGRLCSRHAGTLVSFNTATPSNDLKVASMMAAQNGVLYGWAANGTNASTYFLPAFGWRPLATAEGLLGQVYKHPTGEVYLFNVTGSVPLSAGNVQVLGPYRPDDQILPRSYAYRAVIRLAGDTDGGTEGKYVMQRGPMTFNGELTSDQSNGLPIRELYRSYDAAQEPWATQNKTSIAYDGRGCYWATGHYDGNRSALFFWKGGTCEEVQADVAQDATRFYGLAQSTELIPTINQGGQRYAPPSLCSDEAGRVFYPTRDVGAGLQAIYVIDHRKPGRQYQRPSGAAAGGNTTFTVSAADEIHAMNPFVVGDVGSQIRITSGPNAGIRTISAYNSPTSVDFSGGNLTADTNITWHWVLVAKRDSSNGLTSKIRALAFDIPNTRLWACFDDGFRASTDYGVTWSGLVNFAGGDLTTADADACRTPDGENAHTSVVVGNSGELYWVDTLGGLNKYVGTGPGGTHTRIAPGALPGTINGFGAYGMTLDRLACHLGASTAGALWINQAGDGNPASFWRLDLNLAFTAGNLVTYTSPTTTPANALDQGPTHVIPGTGGRIHMANRFVGQWVYWDPATDTFPGTDLALPAHGNANASWGAVHVLSGQGVVCQMTWNGAAQYLYGQQLTYLWDSVASLWRPWHGSGAQFDARYGTTNAGERLLHATYQMFLDNLRIRFVQDGSVAPTSEFVLNETFTWLGTFGVHRTNTQDLAWALDGNWAEPSIILENETLRTVAGKGSLNAYWNADTTAVATQETAALGSGTLPSCDEGGRNYGWVPRRASGLYNNPTNGPVPNTRVQTSHRAITMGLDLGSSQVVDQVVVHGHFQMPPHHYANDPSQYGVRYRLYYSDDNSSWTQVTAARFVAGSISGSPVAPDAAYRYVHVEVNDGGGTTAPTSAWQGITFDLVGAGLSGAARTHRYWKVIVTTAGGEDVASDLFTDTIFGSIACFDASGNALGVNTDLRLPEAADPNFLASQVLECAFIQDKVGNGGKGGINTVPDAYADGYTDTVTIASGTFDTGAINPLTDLLAYRHPTTGKFLRSEGATAGEPGARGEQTAVRIVSATSSTIVVAARSIPDTLSAADWEVRRPAPVTDQFPDAGEVANDPASGYLMFHDSDIGREFKIPRRSVIMRS